MLQHIVLLLMCIFQNLLFQNLSIPPSWQAFWLVSPYIISVNGTLSLASHLEHCIGISDLPPLWNFQWSSWGRYIQILSTLQHYLLLIVINFSVILHCYAWKLTELFFNLHVWEVSWSTYYTNWTLLFPWLVIETWYGLIFDWFIEFASSIVLGLWGHTHLELWLKKSVLGHSKIFLSFGFKMSSEKKTYYQQLVGSLLIGLFEINFSLILSNTKGLLHDTLYLQRVCFAVLWEKKGHWKWNLNEVPPPLQKDICFSTKNEFEMSQVTRYCLYYS